MPAKYKNGEEMLKTTKEAIVRFWRDQRGVTVSAIILIGILVVAVVAFGAIVTARIEKAGKDIEDSGMSAIELDDTDLQGQGSS